MMKYISILNPKGGCGKTTLAINLARALVLQGRQILLIDSDPQGSARDWHAAAHTPVVDLVGLNQARDVKRLGAMASNYELAVIDGAAKLEDMTAEVIKISDLIMIPIGPSPFDLWAVSDLVRLIKKRQGQPRNDLKACFVIARSIKGTKLSKDVIEAVQATGVPVCAIAINQRQVYPQTASLGQTVFETKNALAIAEMSGLAGDVKQRMGIV